MTKETNVGRKFVKYKNRKLHEEGSDVPYVSMQELDDIVASGADVSVIDDSTGKDVTTMTFARILYERCRDGGQVPAKAIQKILVGAGPRPKRVVGRGGRPRRRVLRAA